RRRARPPARHRAGTPRTRRATPRASVDGSNRTPSFETGCFLSQGSQGVRERIALGLRRRLLALLHAPVELTKHLRARLRFLAGGNGRLLPPRPGHSALLRGHRCRLRARVYGCAERARSARLLFELARLSGRSGGRLGPTPPLERNGQLVSAPGVELRRPEQLHAPGARFEIPDDEGRPGLHARGVRVVRGARALALLLEHAGELTLELVEDALRDDLVAQPTLRLEPIVDGLQQERKRGEQQNA